MVSASRRGRRTDDVSRFTGGMGWRQVEPTKSKWLCRGLVSVHVTCRKFMSPRLFLTLASFNSMSSAPVKYVLSAFIGNRYKPPEATRAAQLLKEFDETITSADTRSSSERWEGQRVARWRPGSEGKQFHTVSGSVCSADHRTKRPCLNVKDFGCESKAVERLRDRVWETTQPFAENVARSPRQRTASSAVLLSCLQRRPTSSSRARTRSGLRCLSTSRRGSLCRFWQETLALTWWRARKLP